MPYYDRDPKGDRNFDNHPYVCLMFRASGLGFKDLLLGGIVAALCRDMIPQ